MREIWQLCQFLPACLGGLGLQSAERTSPAAYWAGRADALPVIHARLRAAAEARELLQTEGWEDLSPAWKE